MSQPIDLSALPRSNPLWPAIEEYVKRAIAKAIRNLRLTVGTVVVSPLQDPDDPLMVIFDGSETAVPVKMIRAFNVFPDARVVCGQVGKDTVAFGVFIDTSEANIVAGIPGAGRFEFDPYAVVGRIYDPLNRMVVELDQQLGVWVTDPDGAPNNRVRIRTEIGQMVLSQSVGDDADYFSGRVVSYTGNTGMPNEWVATDVEGIAYKPSSEYTAVRLRAETLDASTPARASLLCGGNTIPGEILLQTDGVVEIAGTAPGARTVYTGMDEVDHGYDYVKVYRNAAFNHGNTGATQVLTWDTELRDVPGGAWVSGQPTRFIANQDGDYELIGQVGFAANATGTRVSHVRMNSAGSSASGTKLSELSFQTPATAGHVARIPISASAFLVAGEYMEVFTFHNSGVSPLAGSPGLADTWCTFKRVVH